VVVVEIKPANPAYDNKVTNHDPTSLPVPAFMGGTKAIPLTPVVGTPRREYAEMYVLLLPTPGKQRMAFTPTAVPPPEWWADALIPLDDL
jgi:hypothetical protein